MYINQRLRTRISTGLIALFLMLALVPIYQILAKFTPGGTFVQLCTANGMQTVWVAEAVDQGLSPKSGAVAAQASASTATVQSSINSPFGCCEFCWTSVLATVLPLIVVVFAATTQAKFALPIFQAPTFQSFLRQWHVSPRAPPFQFSY